MLADFLGALRTGGPARFTLEMARRDLLLLEEAERSMSERSMSERSMSERSMSERSMSGDGRW